MQPLVYDFGQLTDTTEKDYTTQIVQNYVSIYNNAKCVTVNLQPNKWLYTYIATYLL